MGMGVPLGEIKENWIRAMNNPIAPNVVDDAPSQEIVHEGADLLKGNGLDALPVPISSPGWDNAPYTTSSHFITKDPETGVQNMGNYRGMIKAPNRIGMNPSIELRTGGYIHWEEWKKRGEPMPVAIVLGCPPIVSFTAVQKMPEKLDELAVSGGAGRQAAQCRAGQDRAADGAGRGRGDHRGLRVDRASGARGAVRREPRPRQPSGI